MQRAPRFGLIKRYPVAAMALICGGTLLGMRLADNPGAFFGMLAGIACFIVYALVRSKGRSA
jgi:hypothetical protein